MRFSGCIGHTKKNNDQPNLLFVSDTHEWEVVDDLQSCYHEKILPDRGEWGTVYLNQSVCQVVGYEKSQRTGHTDVILWLYTILYHIICRMYEEWSLSHRNHMLWTDIPCVQSMPYSWARVPFECKESYIMGRPIPWYRSCRNSKCHFGTGESEPWDLWQHVSAYPSICF